MLVFDWSRLYAGIIYDPCCMVYSKYPNMKKITVASHNWDYHTKNTLNIYFQCFFKVVIAWSYLFCVSAHHYNMGKKRILK